MTKQQQEEKVKNFIANDLTEEWWKGGNEPFEVWAHTLIHDYGLSAETIIEMFEELYSAVAAEYGE